MENTMLEKEEFVYLIHILILLSRLRALLIFYDQMK